MPELCQTCATKYGKSLWAGSCICTSSVPISYLGPDPLLPRQTVIPIVVQEEEKDKGKRISKKEMARLERALGKP
jgi:hypothetical protein